MQASSAQLCQDVCGAFDGLPLHGTHGPLHDPMEEPPDQDGLHLDDLHELGLLPHGTSDDPFCDVNTQQPQQPQQPQQQNDLSCRATKTYPDSSSKLASSSNIPQQQQQQQQDDAQLDTQHACSTSNCEHRTVDRQGIKDSIAGHSQAHYGAALHVRTVTQAASHRSFIAAAAVPRHPNQSELLAVPTKRGVSDTSAQQVAAERESHDSSHVSRRIAQPSMHTGGAGVASAELLKAAGEQQSPDVQDAWCLSACRCY